MWFQSMWRQTNEASNEPPALWRQPCNASHVTPAMWRHPCDVRLITSALGRRTCDARSCKPAKVSQQCDASHMTPAIWSQTCDARSVWRQIFDASEKRPCDDKWYVREDAMWRHVTHSQRCNLTSHEAPEGMHYCRTLDQNDLLPCGYHSLENNRSLSERASVS